MVKIRLDDIDVDRLAYLLRAGLDLPADLSDTRVPDPKLISISRYWSPGGQANTDFRAFAGCARHDEGATMPFHDFM